VTIEAGPGELFTTLAREADVPAVVELVNSAYRGASSRRGWTTEADLLGGQRTDAEAILALIAAPDSAILVVRGQSGLGACVHVRKERDGVAHVGMLTVRPALQGSLMGRQLLAAAESYAHRHLGARVVEMTVIDLREELIAWYERRGYRRTPETRPFPYGDERFGIPLRADLRFVVLRRELGR
jgi:ribosomal protein S18 acetylase RimI-like enzyme